MQTGKQKIFKPVRLKDIAEKAGVSRVAVSKVLLGTGGERTRVGEETRQRILSVAAEMEYRPNRVARTLVGGRSGIIGVIIDSQSPPLHFEYLAHIEEKAMIKGYRTMIASEHESMSGIVNHVMDFKSYGVEGMISMSHEYPEFKKEVIDIIRVIPHVVFIGNPGIPDAAFIEVNLTTGICRMIEHLVKRGKRKISLVISKKEYYNSVNARFQGYMEGLKRMQIPYRNNLIWEDTEIIFNLNYDFYSFVQTVIVDGGADAVVAENDMIAAAIIGTLGRKGIKVPEEVAVTGVDNLAFGRLFIPSITTIRQPSDQVARTAIDLLDDMLTGKKAKQKKISIEPEIILRDSA